MARADFSSRARTKRATIVDIGGGDARKIARVLRLHAGDRIEVFDSAAAAFDATIDAIGPVVRRAPYGKARGLAGRWGPARST